MIGLLAPTLLPGLNSAEQQISPYQLRNANPQQLQRLRQLQEMQQRGGGTGGPLTDLIGAFIPGGGQLLRGAGLNQPNNGLNNNQVNQNPGGLAQLLGLAPQRPLNNPYNQLNNLNQARQNVYGRPNQQNANLRSSNANENANENTNENANDNSDNSSDSDADNSNSEDNSGDSGENGESGEEDGGGENQGQSDQKDPSQDPDLQQFNNLQGNENFPGELNLKLN